MRNELLIVGLGYSGKAVAEQALRAGMRVAATFRRETGDWPAGLRPVPFAALFEAVREATHLLITAPPGEAGDPVLAAAGEAVRQAPALRWIGYLSTTGVYGDRGGAAVSETTEPAPGLDRSRRRLAAEQGWREAAAGRPLDLMRLAGIYGPGRSAFDEIRSGRARRILKPGHLFGRIHRDDIAGGVLAAIAHPPPSVRVLNFSDDTPAESAAVLEEAARLLGVTPPPVVPFAQARTTMSEMALSFWSENRRVLSAATQQALHRPWTYPSFREGLRAILAEELGKNRA